MRNSSSSNLLALAALALALGGCVLDRVGVAPTGAGGDAPVPMMTATSGSGGMSSGDSAASTGSGELSCGLAGSGHTCIPAAPAGWQMVSFHQGIAFSCPEGYESPTAVAEAPTPSSTTCTCTCGQPTSNPCTQGPILLRIGGGSCNINTYSAVATGGCDPLGVTINNAGYTTGAVKPLAAKNVACDGTAALPAAPTPPASLTCVPAALPTAGDCTGADVCLPKLENASQCIEHDGDMPCPVGSPYADRRVVGAMGATKDERTCSACSCASIATSCTTAQLTGYDDATCQVHPDTIPADGTCYTGTASSFQNNAYFRYTATPNSMTCTAGAGTSTVSGSIVLESPITVCCEP